MPKTQSISVILHKAMRECQGDLLPATRTSLPDGARGTDINGRPIEQEEPQTGSPMHTMSEDAELAIAQECLPLAARASRDDHSSASETLVRQ